MSISQTGSQKYPIRIKLDNDTVVVLSEAQVANLNRMRAEYVFYQKESENLSQIVDRQGILISNQEKEIKLYKTSLEGCIANNTDYQMIDSLTRWSYDLKIDSIEKSNRKKVVRAGFVGAGIGAGLVAVLKLLVFLL